MPQLEIVEENIIQCFYFTFQRFLIYFIYLFVFRLVVFSAAQFTLTAKDYKICIHYVRQQILAFDIPYSFLIVYAPLAKPHVFSEGGSYSQNEMVCTRVTFQEMLFRKSKTHILSIKNKQ